MKLTKRNLSVASLVILDWVGQYIGYRLGFGVGNRGVSLGMFQGISTWLILGVWLYLLSRKDKRFDLLVWGGLGNLVPRILFGGVWDYIPMYLFWANLSDWVITVGVIANLVLELKQSIWNNLYRLPRRSTSSQ